MLFDIADDEGSGRDFANEANGTYYVATSAGPFGWAVTPGLEHLLAGREPDPRGALLRRGDADRCGRS